MNPKVRVKDPDIQKSLTALRRAAADARKLSEATGTPFYIWQKGRVVNLNPKGRLKRAHKPNAQASSRIKK
jgi:hypothetical protein